jgi:DNA mismatch repair protein MLH1
MFDHSELSRQLFYQLAIRRFGELPSIHLSKSVPVCEFVSEALDLAENKWSPDDGNKEDIALAVTNLLFEKRHLLSKYFSLYVDYEDETVVIREMPALMPGYLPCVAYMPTFILRLATCVDWDIEIRCFDGIAHELALYYSRFEIMIDPDTASVATAPALSEQSIDILSSIILPAYKNYLIPNRKFVSSGGVIEVTSLEKLYKVFERC